MIDMQTILIAGAGKSSTYLIDYLLKEALKNKWSVIVADGNENAVIQRIKKHKAAIPIVTDLSSVSKRRELVKKADIVISMMPPHLHELFASDCLMYKKHLITASYVPPAIRAMDEEARKSGLMFMFEMGLDPGIDHMSACEMIRGVRKVGGIITSFKSYCGGLIAPESDDNPWHYKITWNPRNVVNAGKAGAEYLLNGQKVQIPYVDIFRNPEFIDIERVGTFAGYPNRDSMSYIHQYDLEEVETFMRATLRYPGFCKGWQAVIELGLTDGNDTTEPYRTYADWLKAKSGYTNGLSLKEHVSQKYKLEDSVISMLDWLGIFEEKPLPILNGNNASEEVMLQLLMDKWKIKEEDKDLVVMHHEMVYTRKNVETKVISSMAVIGEHGDYSAMAKTVGLPMAILTTFILNGKIPIIPGVHIPNISSIAKPVLRELSKHGIQFTDKIL
jgi:saccharopine dehydrogenase-like NADP-dependent oxidoreductase